MRSLAVAGLEFLGLALDVDANAAATGAREARISPADAAVEVHVIPAREDLEIARETRRAVA